jgi:hypothetical protein
MGSITAARTAITYFNGVKVDGKTLVVEQFDPNRKKEGKNQRGRLEAEQWGQGNTRGSSKCMSRGRSRGRREEVKAMVKYERGGSRVDKGEEGGTLGRNREDRNLERAQRERRL